jgi:hypothetical protein
MCDCRKRINESLAPKNARLAYGFTIGNGAMDISPPLIELEKIAPRGKKPPILMATFCPFCGEKLSSDENRGGNDV